MAEQKIKIFLVKGCIVSGKRGLPGKSYTVKKSEADLLIGYKHAVATDNKQAMEEAKILVEKQLKREAAAKEIAEDPEETQG